MRFGFGGQCNLSERANNGSLGLDSRPIHEPGANVGVTATNVAGLSNAFSTINNLVNISSGQSPSATLPSGATAPVNELNALANVLNRCAATNGTTGECTQLFGATTISGSAAPADTIDAALNIALNPASNVATLYGFATASPAFAPALSSVPNDWTLAINFSGSGLNQPSSLAIDETGNVWIANYNRRVAELSPQGQTLSPSGGFTGGGLNESYGLTIDNQNNVWISNQQSLGGVNGGFGSLTELSSSGQILSGANGFSGGGVNFPVALASDSNGNIWVANFGSSTASLFSNAGTAISGSSGYGGGHLSVPDAVAIDGSGGAWLANQSAQTVTHISSDGTQATQVTCCDEPAGVAIDHHGNIWVANFNGDSVSEVSSTGTVVSSGYTGSGLFRPQGIAVDGQGNVWVANFHGGSLSEIEGADGTTPGTALSPPAGLGLAAALNQPYALAIDSSGNIWVSSFAANRVTEYVGAAAPVKTPLLCPATKP